VSGSIVTIDEAVDRKVRLQDAIAKLERERGELKARLGRELNEDQFVLNESETKGTRLVVPNRGKPLSAAALTSI
jgi:hypothetical protein